MKKTVLKYGSIGGVIIAAFLAGSWSFMVDNLDNPASELFGYASMVIALSTIFVGVKSYRDNELDGTISFGKAFLLGLYISLLASSFYVVTWMIISSTIAPDFMTNYVDAAIAKLQASDMSAEEIEEKAAEMRMWIEYYKNPFIKAGLTLMEILPVGILISLISAAILRRKN
ncbi:MAG: DUF4199 domain-containing protein [Crocinitomicaceae bacterium]|nr:DUF4199 domain-containing protein [Crocinitomicaceae bacterium]|tara:strand:- start:1493 stop:2008 length:516 start_codon:yes stop_codon:yes gene_type:complete